VRSDGTRLDATVGSNSHRWRARHRKDMAGGALRNRANERQIPHIATRLRNPNAWLAPKTARVGSRSTSATSRAAILLLGQHIDTRGATTARPRGQSTSCRTIGLATTLRHRPPFARKTCCLRASSLSASTCPATASHAAAAPFSADKPCGEPIGALTGFVNDEGQALGA